MPFISTSPEPVVQNSRGEWVTPMPRKGPTYGYQDKSWTGVAWVSTDLSWVKRPVYVLKAISQDSFYNCGKQEILADRESYGIAYKVIFDRAGQYLRTFYGGVGGMESADKQTRFIIVRIQHIVDDRSGHSSVIDNDVDPETFNANLNMDDFTLSGFQKYCK